MTTRDSRSSGAWRAPRPPGQLVAASTPAAASGTLAAASGTTIVATPQQKRAAPRGQGSPAYLDLLARPSPPRPTHTSMSTKVSKTKATRSDEARAPRRGELEGIKASYNGISDFEEFHRLCSLLDANKVKTRELNNSGLRGKIITSTATAKRYVYGRRGGMFFLSR